MGMHDKDPVACSKCSYEEAVIMDRVPGFGMAEFKGKGTFKRGKVVFDG
jgi:hypothetical protein